MSIAFADLEVETLRRVIDAYKAGLTSDANYPCGVSRRIVKTWLRKAETELALRVERDARIITLRCESDTLRYDQREFRVVLESEDDEAWYGRPVDNPACPVLTYPRYAWKVSES